MPVYAGAPHDVTCVGIYEDALFFMLMLICLFRTGMLSFHDGKISEDKLCIKFEETVHDQN